MFARFVDEFGHRARTKAERLLGIRLAAELPPRLIADAAHLEDLAARGALLVVVVLRRCEPHRRALEGRRIGPLVPVVLLGLVQLAGLVL